MVTDNPAFKHAIEKINAEYGEHQDSFKGFLETAENAKEALRLLSERVHRQVGKYCKAYGLSWRLWQLCSRLHQKAIAEHAEEFRRYTGPNERSRVLSEGLIKSVDERDESSEYRKFNQEFRKNGRRLSKKAREVSKNARNALSDRVINESSFVLNNAGCKPLVRAFNPAVIYMDETGQAPIAAMCRPLIYYRSRKGCSCSEIPTS